MKAKEDITTNADDCEAVAPLDASLQYTPNQNPPLWKRIFFFQADALIWHGFKTRLEARHLFKYASLKTEVLSKRFHAEQKMRREVFNDNGLLRVVLSGNTFGLVWTGLLYLFSQGCSIVGPLMLQQIVAGLSCFQVAEQNPSLGIQCQDKSQLYLWCIGFLVAPIAQSFAENHVTYQMFIIGTRMRNSLMAAIYRKCVRLSSASLQAQSVGKVVTLMSNDAQKLQDAMTGLHALWVSPILICVVLGLLWLQVGWATFVGLAIMLLLGPVTGFLVKKLTELRRGLLQWTDKRVGIMNEIISNMQIIKFYAWEASFKSEALGYRKLEAAVLYLICYWQSFFALVLYAGPTAVAIFCFGSYTLAGNNIPTSRAYAALALFSLLRFPLSFLPMYITMIVNALVALKRIGGFLDLDEVEEVPSTLPPATSPEGTTPAPEPHPREASSTAATDDSPTHPAAATPSQASSSNDGPASPIVHDIPGLCPPSTLTVVVGGDDESKAEKAPAHDVINLSAVAAGVAGVPGTVIIRNATFSWGAPPPSAKGEEGVGSAKAPATAGAPGASKTDKPTKGGSPSPSKEPRVKSKKGKEAAAVVEEGGDEKAAEKAAEAVEDPLALQDINLEVKPGSLVMVIGSVGSGKSSLLGAMVGQIGRKSGDVCVCGRVAYVSQTAWIMNETLQENILLGSDLVPERYKHAVEVSQLMPDIRILKDGDLTEIGDRGINLSGGQKQRVSIARAVYSDADVYVLDDPLSAVDSHVSTALFEQCIRGSLMGKTVILATNALQHLSFADNIVWLDGGRIRAQGSYQDVLAAGLDLKDLVHLDKKEEEEASGEEAAVIPTLKALVPEDNLPKAGALKGTLTMRRVAVDLDRNLTGVEAREEGSVGLHVVWSYIKATGSVWKVLFLFFMFCVEQGTRCYTDYWVGIWFSGTYNLNLGTYLGVYTAFGAFYAMWTFFRAIVFSYMLIHAAVNIHNALLNHLVLLPKLFFDTNPTGRILNRFSRDTEIMDTVVTQSVMQFTGCIASYVSILIVICIATKWFTVALPPLTIVYIIIQRYYIPAAREVQRLESLSRSPIYSIFSETLLGVPTIRAYRKEQHFVGLSDYLMEMNANAFLTQKLSAAWLAMRLDFMGTFILTLTGVLTISGSISPSLAGLALSYALDLTKYLKFGTQMASKAETDFNSVERILQYMAPETEAPHETSAEVAKTLPPKWPGSGDLKVEGLSMRYRPGLPLVLVEVTFHARPSEKIGIVGRTGGGKSSMFMALFRMVEPAAGTVFIDGVDYRTLGLATLRSKMAIIPQDPFMFSGTVRRNLDPFSEHGDDMLWQVLEEAGLKEAITVLENKLDATVSDNGANFSLGQRQLFCMARAMLRNSSILMLDEATASVDLDTDAALQAVIRTRFAAATTLTIAHRLSTIADSDRVLVMDGGRVVENDHPEELLKRHDGSFTGLVEQTGRANSRYLRTLASTRRRNLDDVAGAGSPAGTSSRSHLGLSASASTKGGPST